MEIGCTQRLRSYSNLFCRKDVRTHNLAYRKLSLYTLNGTCCTNTLYKSAVLVRISSTFRLSAIEAFYLKREERRKGYPADGRRTELARIFPSSSPSTRFCKHSSFAVRSDFIVGLTLDRWDYYSLGVKQPRAEAIVT